MKKILKVTGIVFLVIITLFASIAIWTYSKSSAYEKTAVPYIYKIVPELSKWDTDIWFEHLDPSVIETIDKNNMAKVAKFLSKMGEFEYIEPPEFQLLSTKATTSDGVITLITYNFIAHYSNGDANIQMIIRDLDTELKVYKFDLNSPVLFD